MMERFVYAPESRYATPDGGNERSVAGLTRADVVDFYRSRYRPQSVTVVVVGDISIAEAERLVEGVLGKWTAPGGRPGHVRVADRGAPGGSAVHLVTRADASQSELRLAHVGLPRSTPDYFAVTVMNSILGGLFSSRVNLNLREVHAYTYGAHSTFEWRRGAGPFSVSTAVQSASTDAAAREVLLEIERMRETDVSDGELSLATSYLAGVFPIRYETTSAIATALANLVIYGLRDDFYDSYRADDPRTDGRRCSPRGPCSPASRTDTAGRGRRSRRGAFAAGGARDRSRHRIQRHGRDDRGMTRP